MSKYLLRYSRTYVLHGPQQLWRRSLGVRPEDCAVFEDVPAGIQAGKAAGMTVVAVDDEFSAHMAEEKNRLADCHIHSFLDLFGTGDQFDDKGEPS